MWHGQVLNVAIQVFALNFEMYCTCEKTLLSDKKLARLTTTSSADRLENYRRNASFLKFTMFDLSLSAMITHMN